MNLLEHKRRWIVVALLFFLSVVNYLDRQSLSVLAPTLRDALHFSVQEYSWAVSAFLVAYTLGYLFCGRILDRFGAKLSIGVAVALWSVAGALHAAAASWQHLAAARFLLGLGESFNAPGGAKVIRAWVPKRERALSMAVFSTGNIVGAIVAPPLVSALALHLSWRPAFLITGAVGFVWLAFWKVLYHAPQEDPRLSEEERTLIFADAATQPASMPGFWDVARHPLVLAFILARFLTDSLPYFFSFWLPEFLARSHGFGLAQIGMLAWIPYLAADIGGLTGGASSDWLVRRGLDPLKARRRVLVTAACLTPAALVAVHSPSSGVALGCIGLVLAAHSAWITNLLTYMTESMPPSLAGQVVAWSGIGGSVGGILANLATGAVVEAYGYEPVFSGLAFVHLTAFVLLSVLSRRAGVRALSEGSEIERPASKARFSE